MKRVALIVLAFLLWVTVTPGCTIWKSKPEEEYGRLAVTSEPSGAKVYLDGDYVGVTPLLIGGIVTGVPAGKHTILLQAPGYCDWEGTVYVIAGKTTTVEVILVPSE